MSILSANLPCEDHTNQVPEETDSGLGLAGFSVFASPTILQPQSFPYQGYSLEQSTCILLAFFSQQWLPQTLSATHPFHMTLFSTTRLILKYSIHHLVLHAYQPLMATYHLQDKSIVHRAKCSPSQSPPVWLTWAFPSEQSVYSRWEPLLSPPIQILPLKVCSNPASHTKAFTHLLPQTESLHPLAWHLFFLSY